MKTIIILSFVFSALMISAQTQVVKSDLIRISNDYNEAERDLQVRILKNALNGVTTLYGLQVLISRYSGATGQGNGKITFTFDNGSQLTLNDALAPEAYNQTLYSTTFFLTQQEYNALINSPVVKIWLRDASTASFHNPTPVFNELLKTIPYNGK